MLSRLTLALSVLMVEACVHYVYNPIAPAQDVVKVEEELRRECGPDRCQLDKCWRETEDLTVCQVAFSFTPPWEKSASLLRVQSSLEERGLSTAFCAHDSEGTQVAEAASCALMAGVLSALTHSSSSDSVAACGGDDVTRVGFEAHDAAKMSRAVCSTTPVARSDASDESDW